MIIDKFANLASYVPLVKNLDKGLEAIKKLRHKEAGRYEFDGGYFMVQQGTTKPMEEGTFEAHKKYIDIQIILDGSEDVAWTEISELREEIPYDAQKDTTRYAGKETIIFHAGAGMCYIAFPHDGHKAVRHVAAEQHYTKIVMKLPTR